MMKSSGAADRYRHTVRKLSFTGEPMDTATRAFVEETFGVPVCSMYGTTEVGVILADYPGAADYAVKPGALGRPVPGVRVEVQRPDGERCTPDELGEIVVWRRDAWFPTRPRLGRRGRSLPRGPRGRRHHLGRVDDGPWDRTCSSSARTSRRPSSAWPTLRGLAVKAFAVSRGRATTFARELQELVRTRLSQHEYPRHVPSSPTFPRRPRKINRALRDSETVTPASSGGAHPCP
jgi:acetyl-CoA synthetase